MGWQAWHPVCTKSGGDGVLFVLARASSRLLPVTHIQLQEGTRIGQDDVLWKPPGASGVGWHQDSDYISNQFLPRDQNSLTVWLALDDADAETGVVQYAKGSHRWPLAQVRQDVTESTFHGNVDPRAGLRRAAEHAGVDYDAVEVEDLHVPAGMAFFFFG